MTGKLPSSEPHAERAIRRVLPPDEEILWAARSRGPTWREWFSFTVLLSLLAFFTWATLWGKTSIMVPLQVMIVWRLLGEWFYVFAVTPKRIVILRTLPFRSWIYKTFDTMDVSCLKLGPENKKIQFGGPANFLPSGTWSEMLSARGQMREYIDNVPEIESVRALILGRIATAQVAAKSEPRTEIRIPPPTDKPWIKSAT